MNIFSTGNAQTYIWYMNFVIKKAKTLISTILSELFAILFFRHFIYSFSYLFKVEIMIMEILTVTWSGQVAFDLFSISLSISSWNCDNYLMLSCYYVCWYLYPLLICLLFDVISSKLLIFKLITLFVSRIRIIWFRFSFIEFTMKNLRKFCYNILVICIITMTLIPVRLRCSGMNTRGKFNL